MCSDLRSSSPGSNGQSRGRTEGEAEVLISARNLSKAYRIWNNPAQRLLGPLFAEAARWTPGSLGLAMEKKARESYRDFFALQDVSFELRRGEAVGVVGRNGAGKSTLLQLIAGTLQPSAGTIEVRGRVAALLELGAGFNPEFTGRENVFLSGAVLGLSKAEMAARFDSVAAFADIGDFIEQPVKTYSSGMMMRLAFAVNTCVDPEVLIVDEALSVGDAPFQSKCFRRLRQLIDGGVSLLFVSHDLGTVRSICTRALWLKNGKAEMWGEAKEVAKAYERFCWQEQGVALSSTLDLSKQERAPAPMLAANKIDDSRATLLLPNPDFTRARERSRFGTGAVVLENVIARRADGSVATTVDYDEELVFFFVARVCSEVDSECIVSIRVKDLHGNYVLSAHDIFATHRLKARAGERWMATLKIRLPLHHQQYSILAGIFGFQGGTSRISGSYDFSLADVWEVVEDAIFLKVNPCSAMPLPGPVHVAAPVSLQPFPE
ncbi:MAG: ABC transporter ATP-binding protein [Opitutus sp.]|nr:ABC transporter ATP-binding protein [Opitutus sp.]